MRNSHHNQFTFAIRVAIWCLSALRFLPYKLFWCVSARRSYWHDRSPVSELLWPSLPSCSLWRDRIPCQQLHGELKKIVWTFMSAHFFWQIPWLQKIITYRWIQWRKIHCLNFGNFKNTFFVMDYRNKYLRIYFCCYIKMLLALLPCQSTLTESTRAFWGRGIQKR